MIIGFPEVVMDEQVYELAKLGKALAPDQRARLIDILLESLQESPISEVEQAWELEIEQRLADYDGGDTISIDSEEVFAKARSIAK
jgi:putative addiction module component (TIGR02574 family)